MSEDVIELLIYHQPSVKPSLTLHPFGVLGYVAGHSLTGSRNGDGIVGLHNGNKVWRVSPDIYPPFKGVTTQHYLLWNGMESHIIEICEMDPLGCSRVFPVEVCY